MRNGKYCLSSQGVFSSNLQAQGNITLKPEFSGKMFTSNLRILLKDCVLRCALPNVTYIINARFSQVSGSLGTCF